MSRILIIGGHGKIALLLAPLLAARGDEVTSLVRNPDHVDDVRAAGAMPLVLDVVLRRKSQNAPLQSEVAPRF